MPIVGQWGGEQGLMAMLLAILRGGSPEDVKNAAEAQLLLLADQIDEENGIELEGDETADEEEGEPEPETAVSATRVGDPSFWDRMEHPKPKP
jgi:hypothetical protein